MTFGRNKENWSNPYLRKSWVREKKISFYAAGNSAASFKKKKIGKAPEFSF